MFSDVSYLFAEELNNNNKNNNNSNNYNNSNNNSNNNDNTKKHKKKNKKSKKSSSVTATTTTTAANSENDDNSTSVVVVASIAKTPINEVVDRLQKIQSLLKPRPVSNVSLDMRKFNSFINEVVAFIVVAVDEFVEIQIFIVIGNVLVGLLLLLLIHLFLLLLILWQ